MASLFSSLFFAIPNVVKEVVVPIGAPIFASYKYDKSIAPIDSNTNDDGESQPLLTQQGVDNDTINFLQTNFSKVVSAVNLAVIAPEAFELIFNFMKYGWNGVWNNFTPTERLAISILLSVGGSATIYTVYSSIYEKSNKTLEGTVAALGGITLKTANFFIKLNNSYSDSTGISEVANAATELYNTMSGPTAPTTTFKL